MPTPTRAEIIDIAAKAVRERYPSETAFEDVTQHDDWAHWVARFCMVRDRYLLVEGQRRTVNAIRGPFSGKATVNKSINRMRTYIPALTREETMKADVLYRYEGEEAAADYIQTLKKLNLIPEDPGYAQED